MDNVILAAVKISADANVELDIFSPRLLIHKMMNTTLYPASGEIMITFHPFDLAMKEIPQSQPNK